MKAQAPTEPEQAPHTPMSGPSTWHPHQAPQQHTVQGGHPYGSPQPYPHHHHHQHHQHYQHHHHHHHQHPAPYYQYPPPPPGTPYTGAVEGGAQPYYYYPPPPGYVPEAPGSVQGQVVGGPPPFYPPYPSQSTGPAQHSPHYYAPHPLEASPLAAAGPAAVPGVGIVDTAAASIRLPVLGADCDLTAGYPPEGWLYEQHWRRMYMFKLLGVTRAKAPGASEDSDSGVFQCTVPLQTGGSCNAIITDRGGTGSDLESHLASTHNIDRLPPQFEKPMNRWTTGLCDCCLDCKSALDCLLCPCCFVGRITEMPVIHWERNVLPYVKRYGSRPTGCQDSCCEICIMAAIAQPIIWVFSPLMCCGFIDTTDDSFLTCMVCSDAVFTTKHLSRIDEGQCETKCKLLWCCPLVMCQTYRELRIRGVDPGLTCCGRDADEEAAAVRIDEANAMPVPTLVSILAANPGFAATSLTASLPALTDPQRSTQWTYGAPATAASMT
jgi:hypothetical protein